MNYKDLIIEGCSELADLKYLTDFLCRKYEKLATRHFTSDEFFEECLISLTGIHSDLDETLKLRAKELKFRLKDLNNKTGNFDPLKHKYTLSDLAKLKNEYETELKDGVKASKYLETSDGSKKFRFNQNHINVIKNAIEAGATRFSFCSAENNEHASFESKKKKLKAGYYVLAYIYDMTVTNQTILQGKKAEMERIGHGIFKEYNAKKNPNTYYSANTFYQNLNELVENQAFLDEKLLDNSFNKDWRQEVIKLCKHPKEVKEFIDTKFSQGK